MKTAFKYSSVDLCLMICIGGAASGMSDWRSISCHI